MPKLCILWSNIKSSIVIFMGRNEVLIWLPIQENVTSVEINGWIIRIFLNSIIEILFGVFLSIDMIVSQSLVIVMNCSGLKTNCFVVMNKSIFKFSLFEVRQPQVVVRTSSIVLHFNGFLQVLNRSVEVKRS
jgi:hypothetical protein